MHCSDENRSPLISRSNWSNIYSSEYYRILPIAIRFSSEYRIIQASSGNPPRYVHHIEQNEKKCIYSEITVLRKWAIINSDQLKSQFECQPHPVPGAGQPPATLLYITTSTLHIEIITPPFLISKLLLKFQINM